MGKDKSKDRDARRAGKFVKKKTGIPELEGYYFGHGEERSGAKFNKVVEKIADYARLEISKDIFYLIRDGIEPDWEEIQVPGKNPGAGKMKKFELDYNSQMKDKKVHNENKCKAFGIILEQCKGITKSAVKADPSFDTLERKDDVVGLLALIRNLCYGTDSKRYISWTQQALLRRTIGFYQLQGESIQNYAANFLEQVRVLEESYGTFVPTSDLITTVELTREIGDGDEAVEETYTEMVLADEGEIKLARNKFLACLFLAGVDRTRYKDAIDELNNDYMRHGKEYPQDVQSMMEWLSKRRGTGGPSKKEEETADGVLTSFAQLDRIKCRSCGRKGHLSYNCPDLSEQERVRIREASNRYRTDDESVRSNQSYRSDSQSSLDSRSSGSVSRNDRRRGRRAPTPPRGRTGVLNNMNLSGYAHAFRLDERPTSFS